MKISRLRRALAVFLSAAMLIMCTPFGGIMASAAETAEKHQGSQCVEHGEDWIGLTKDNLKDYAPYDSGRDCYLWSTSGNFYLSADITNFYYTIIIPRNVDVTLCLNGKTLGFGNATSYFSVLGSLNLCDCTETDEVPGGKIGGTGSGYGLVYVTDSGTFKMYGGQIVADSADGVYCEGNFDLYNGIIDGGGSKAGVNFWNGAFNMRGGKICGSSVGISNKSGASWSSTPKAVNISGGVITGNTNALAVHSRSLFNISGSPQISGNSTNVDVDVSGGAIDLSGGLTDGAEIYVTVNKEGKFAVNANPGDEKYFISADSRYAVSQEDTDINMVRKVSVIFDANGGTFPLSQTVTTVSLPKKLTDDVPVPTREGYIFTGWYTADDTKIESDTVLSDNQRLYAQWEAEENCVKELSVNYNPYVALNGYNNIMQNPQIPSIEYNYSFLNFANNTPSMAASAGTPKFYYVNKGAVFSTDTASEYDGTAKVDISTYDYYFVQTINTASGLKIFDTPTLINNTLTSKVESFTENSVTISCKADVLEVVSEITGLTFNPDITASDFKFSSETPTEIDVTAKAKTLSGKELQISGEGYFINSEGDTAITIESDTDYTLTVELYGDYEDVKYIIGKAGSTSDADAALSSQLTAAGFTRVNVGPMCIMFTGNVYSYHDKHTPASADNGKDATCTEDGKESDTVCDVCGETITEGKVIPALGHDYDENDICTRCGEVRPSVKAAEDIGKALDSLKPTNNTTQDDVQKIVDDNKGDTKATVTTFELTPATTEADGSLKVTVTVSDGTNTETVEKTYTIEKLTAEPEKHEHTFGAWIAVKEATATEEGLLRRTCTVEGCTEVEEKVIPKLEESKDESESGNVVDTTPEDNSFSAANPDVTDTAENIELTPDESAAIADGSTLSIFLKVTENLSDDKKEDEKAITDKADSEELTIGSFLDVSLFKQIGDNTPTAVTETKKPIKVSFIVPDDLIAEGRAYYIIRTHGSETTIIECEFDPATKTCTFETDKFSSYAIAYKAAPVEDDEDDIEKFVERLYLYMLGRHSDPEGKANHVANLRNGETAVKVSFDFVYSDEFKNMNLSNKEIAERLYLTFLDRTPDEAGLADWTATLDGGCSIGHLFYGFTQSNEFTELCEKYGIVRGDWTVMETRDVSSKLTAFVSRLYTKALNRTYDVNGLNDHTANYIENHDVYQLAYDFIFSSEFIEKELSDEDFVDTMYHTFFDREGDPDGRADWLGKLKSGMSREEVLAGFVGSQECADLVAKFGI